MSEIEPKELSLKEALATGKVVLQEEVEKIVQEEMAKEEKSLRKKLTKEIKKELEKKKEEGRYALTQLERYREGTTLTNLEFVKHLISLNIPSRYAQVLRDEHMKLPAKEIWRIIRDNYKGK